jgi:hypothetical protein
MSGVPCGELATVFARAVGAAAARTVDPPGATTIDVRTTRPCTSRLRDSVAVSNRRTPLCRAFELNLFFFGEFVPDFFSYQIGMKILHKI